ncbi:unnamed protein product, partial [Linum tenue]
LTPSQIATVGFSTATTLFILGSTSLRSLLYCYISLPDVRPLLRRLRRQVHPVQSRFCCLQTYHSQVLARPRRPHPRPLCPPLPRLHHRLLL